MAVVQEIDHAGYVAFFQGGAQVGRYEFFEHRSSSGASPGVGCPAKLAGYG
jgi:hypothetical protein